jgi:fibronectin type 3 domain-containing protein
MVKITLWILLFASTVCAENIHLKWDANSETDLAGYRVYHQRPVRSRGFSQYTTIRGATEVTFTGMSSNHKYYFGVTAFNTADMESGLSNIVPVNVPTVEQRGNISGSIQ